MPHCRRWSGLADANNARICAVRQSFGGTTNKMDRVHAEASALGEELLCATAAAAATGKILRSVAPNVL
jgi:hypothetical protein